jgi:hypothetical protein
MGMYDTFVGRCPSCGRDFEIQTKLFSDTMRTIGVGDLIVGGVADVRLLYSRLRLKGTCGNCESPIVASFAHSRLVRFVRDGASFAEGPWGALEEIEDKEHENERLHQEVLAHEAEIKSLVEVIMNGPRVEVGNNLAAEALARRIVDAGWRRQ